MAYRRAKPVFLWIAAIPILLLGAAMWSRAQYRGLLSLMDHTRQVQLAIQDLLVSLTDAETARRGYLATADPSYRQVVDASADRIPDILRRVTDLTRENPAQHANVQALESLVNGRVALLQETSQPGHEPAIEVEKRSGLAISVQLNSVIASLMAEENRIFEQRKKATAAADFAAEAFLVAGCIATIILLIMAYRIMGRYASDRDRADSDVRRANQQLHEKIQQLDQLNRELESRVKERTASLERSNRDLQQFAFVASHDLQEPLRMIASYMGLLSKNLRGKLAPEEEQYMRFALDGAARMQALIRDLLAYAQAGSQAPELKQTRLSEVVKQARYAVLESVRETRAEISVGDLPEVYADPLKMSLVFQNLISNAIKFRKPGAKPSIHIEAQRDAEMWRVAVRDDGIGFDPKYSERIFVAFQRLHGKNEYPGTGIGLAICKRIIEGHGGEIWADGHPGGGATFYFTLPATAASSPPAEGSPEVPSLPFRQVRGAGPAA